MILKLIDEQSLFHIIVKQTQSQKCLHEKQWQYDEYL
jgi:hypothetical protein